MNVKTYNPMKNSNEIGECLKNKDIEIKRGYYLDKCRHKMIYEPCHEYEGKYVYLLSRFGKEMSDSIDPLLINLSFFENLKFLFLQRKHWLQKEDNIRYVINILFLLSGLVIAYLRLK